jgi:hypothetical protein
MAILSCCVQLKVEAMHECATYSLLKIINNNSDTKQFASFNIQISISKEKSPVDLVFMAHN